MLLSESDTVTMYKIYVVHVIFKTEQTIIFFIMRTPSESLPRAHGQLDQIHVLIQIVREFFRDYMYIIVHSLYM